MVAVRYGLAAALSCQYTVTDVLFDVDETLQDTYLQLQLVVTPAASYVYDGMTTTQVSTLFNNITVYNEMD